MQRKATLVGRIWDTRFCSRVKILLRGSQHHCCLFGAVPRFFVIFMSSKANARSVHENTSRPIPPMVFANHNYPATFMDDGMLYKQETQEATNQLHGIEQAYFFRGSESLSQSRNFHPIMVPRMLLPRSQHPTSGPYPIILYKKLFPLSYLNLQVYVNISIYFCNS